MPRCSLTVTCVKEHLSFHDDGHEEKWDLRHGRFTFWGLIQERVS